MTKRFYKRVETGKADAHFQVHLDGRPVRTPLRAVMNMPSRALAELSAAEWDAQDETIDPHSMPVTRLITTVIDLMPDRRPAAEAEIKDYAETDMLCYRSHDPVELARRQDELWQPWLDWAATQLDAPLYTTAGIEPVAQPATSLAAIARHIEQLDDWHLVAAHAVTKLTGSSILGLAMTNGTLAGQTAKALALVDEQFVIERWGLEAEQAKRHQGLGRDLLAAEAFLQALGSPDIEETAR